MEDFVKLIDHVSIGVRQARGAFPLYVDLLGGKFHSAGDETKKGFRWIIFEYPGGAKIELIEPAGEDSFVARFLDSRGEGAHHITFKVDDVEGRVRLLKEQGYHVILEDYSNPAWKEAFIHPKEAHGILLQLAETNLTDAEERAASTLTLEEFLR